MQENLEKLKQDEHYYGEFGRQWLSNSDIKKLLEDPRQFGVPQEDNPVLAKGRLFHQLVLEPEKAKDVVSVNASTRNTKIYKEAIAALEEPFLLLDKEVEEIKEWARAITANMTFFDLIYDDDNEYEVPAIGEVCGFQFKGKADIVAYDHLIDIKTTGDISRFKYSARDYNYDSQAYIYQCLFNKPLVFLVVDKSTHQLGLFRPTEDFLLFGREKVEKAIEVYKSYFSEDARLDIEEYFIEEKL